MEGSKFTDTQKAFVVKQGEEGTPVAEIVYVGPLPHHLEGCSFKGGFGGSGGGTNARTASPPATVSLYWPILFVGLTSDDEKLGHSRTRLQRKAILKESAVCVISEGTLHSHRNESQRSECIGNTQKAPKRPFATNNLVVTAATTAEKSRSRSFR